MNKIKNLIETSNFAVGFRGYAPKEVDDFLDVLLVAAVDLENRNEALKNELAQKVKELATPAPETEPAPIEEVEDASEALEAECEKLRKELSKYETLKSEFMAMIVQIRQETAEEMKDGQQEVITYKEKLAKKEAETEAMRDELEALRSTVRSMNDCFQKILSDGQAIATSKDSHIEFLKSQLEVAASQKENISVNLEECHTLSERISTLITPISE